MICSKLTKLLRFLLGFVGLLLISISVSMIIRTSLWLSDFTKDHGMIMTKMIEPNCIQIPSFFEYYLYSEESTPYAGKEGCYTQYYPEIRYQTRTQEDIYFVSMQRLNSNIELKTESKIVVYRNRKNKYNMITDIWPFFVNAAFIGIFGLLSILMLIRSYRKIAN